MKAIYIIIFVALVNICKSQNISLQECNSIVKMSLVNTFGIDNTDPIVINDYINRPLELKKLKSGGFKNFQFYYVTDQILWQKIENDGTILSFTTPVQTGHISIENRFVAINPNTCQTINVSNRKIMNDMNWLEMRMAPTMRSPSIR